MYILTFSNQYVLIDTPNTVSSTTNHHFLLKLNIYFINSSHVVVVPCIFTCFRKKLVRPKKRCLFRANQSNLATFYHKSLVFLVQFSSEFQCYDSIEKHTQKTPTRYRLFLTFSRPLP